VKKARGEAFFGITREQANKLFGGSNCTPQKKAKQLRQLIKEGTL